MKNEDGIWRTIGGRRIFIKEGQDLATAMRDSGKFKLKGNSKKKISKATQENEKGQKINETMTRRSEIINKLDDETKDLNPNDTYNLALSKLENKDGMKPTERQYWAGIKERYEKNANNIPKGSLKDYANDLAKNYMIQEEYDDKETPRYIQDIDAGRYGNMTDEEAIKNWLDGGADLIYNDDARELLEKNGIEVEDDDPYATYTKHLSKELLNNYKADKERLQNSSKEPEEDFDEELMELQNQYDEYLQNTEGRGISYGEIAYLQELTPEERQNFFKELEEQASQNPMEEFSSPVEDGLSYQQGDALKKALNQKLTDSQKDAMLDKLRNKDIQLQKPMSARDFTKNTNDLANEVYDGKITRDEYARKYDDLKHTMESQNENVNKYTEGKVDDTNLLKNANVNKNINDSKDRLIKE